MLSASERETLSNALGIGWKGEGRTRRTPWRNRTAHNTRNPETSADHRNLEELGLLRRDPAEDYGRMRVYRVTNTGALAITGRLLPKKLAALLPQPEPMKLAA